MLFAHIVHIFALVGVTLEESKRYSRTQIKCWEHTVYSGWPLRLKERKKYILFFLTRNLWQSNNECPAVSFFFSKGMCLH